VPRHCQGEQADIYASFAAVAKETINGPPAGYLICLCQQQWAHMVANDFFQAFGFNAAQAEMFCALCGDLCTNLLVFQKANAPVRVGLSCFCLACVISTECKERRAQERSALSGGLRCS
jgi:hypothetical protein